MGTCIEFLTIRQKMGVSLNIVNQSVGASLTQNIKAGYAYHIYISGGHKLSLGISAGIYFRQFDFSKIEAGKIELKHVDFNLGNILEDIINVLAANADQKES